MARSCSRRSHAGHISRSTRSDLGEYTEDFLKHVVVLSMHQENANTKQKRNGISIAHIGHLQIQSYDHGESYPGCIKSPLTTIFEYVVEDIGMHLLDEIGRISLSRSLEKGKNWGCCC
jgi:hypothetical protein